MHTKSVNSITVDGVGQHPRTAINKGRIVEFSTSKLFDFVAGEAGNNYSSKLKKFS
jgi:hypothetical protein